VLLVSLLLLLSPLGLGDMQQDVVECEQAMSHVEGCCDGFRAGRTRCVSEGCGSDYTKPALSLEESRCIEGLSCDEVRQRGLCRALEDLASPQYHTDGGAAVQTAGDRPPLCL
jgi:hypothetical protein